jgi:hypothetical protein
MTKAGKVDERFVQGVTVIIPCKAKWAYLDKPDTKYKKQWSIDMVLDETWKEKLQGSNFNVKQDADGDWVLKAYRLCETRSGKEMSPPDVIDIDKQPFTEGVGNGSKCRVRVFCKCTSPQDPTRVVAYLDTVQVVEHVPYNGGSDSDFDVTDGDFSDDVPF